MKSVLRNNIIVYENESIKNKLSILIEIYSKIFKTKSKKINVSSKRWIKINIISNEFSRSTRVFKIKLKNREFINKKFDNLHKVDKMKWITDFTFYIFSIFVIWITMRFSDKSSTRKKRVVIDIRNLNKISKFDVYSMSLQQNFIDAMHKSSYILLMNCVSFFH